MASTLILDPGPMVWGYAVAGGVAAAVGLADIFTRYRDDPWGALFTPWAAGYLLLNGFFGVAAFWMSAVLAIVEVGEFRAADGVTVELIKSALLVGFGATLILRAVAFKISIGGKDSEVGASTIVDALLRACDQEIERVLARRKDQLVRRLMRGVSFAQAMAFIPNYCLALLEDDEKRADRLGELVASIVAFKAIDPAANPPEPEDPQADSQRAFLLGSTLINIFGYDLAKAVIAGFQAEMAAPSVASPPVAPTPAPPPAPRSRRR